MKSAASTTSWYILNLNYELRIRGKNHDSPLQDVDGVGGLCQVVSLELHQPRGQARGTYKLLVVGIVETLLSTKGYFSFHFL